MSADLAWAALTRLGEAGIVLPPMLFVAAGMAWGSRRAAVVFPVWWPIVLAASVVTVSKIAFLGFGWGIASIDFTGLSGHAMVAAAIYPLLAAAFVSKASPWFRPAVLAASVAAIVVAVSRVVVDAHSASEVVGGGAVGAAAAAASIGALRRAAIPRLSGAWLAPALAWLLFTMPAAPMVASHSWITQLAMSLSGREQPFSRADLHRATRGPGG